VAVQAIIYAVMNASTSACCNRACRWVEPRLVGEVSFAERTTDGILRQPSWRGLRIDKEPGEVHREDPL
jgi:ATP-dependent DNA ligase